MRQTNKQKIVVLETLLQVPIVPESISSCNSKHLQHVCANKTKFPVSIKLRDLFSEVDLCCVYRNVYYTTCHDRHYGKF